MLVFFSTVNYPRNSQVHEQVAYWRTRMPHQPICATLRATTFVFKIPTTHPPLQEIVQCDLF